MTRPNVLILIADQMRADVLGVNGAPVCQTPHMDQLAVDGVNIDHAFTSTPLCTPARAALWTGRYPHTTGLVANTHYADTPTPRLPDHEQLLFEHLASSGYHCGYVGKWHLNYGDEATEARSRGIADFYDDHVAAKLVAQRRNLAPLETVGGARKTQAQPPPLVREAAYAEEYHHDFAIADQTVEMLCSYQQAGLGNSDHPFALVCSFYGPHFPLEVCEPYGSLYSPQDVPIPPSFEDSFEGKPQGQITHRLLHLADHLSWSEWQVVIARYWGYVTFIDAMLGRVIGELDSLGLADNTIVLALADHGEMAGHHRMFNKGPYFYEDVMRVPMIWRWPGRIASTRERDPGFISLVDITPTILELLHVEPVADAPSIQGVSRASALLGQPPLDTQQVVFGETNVGDKINPQDDARMVRTLRWKYVWRRDDVEELYDLNEDPHELVNLAASMPDEVLSHRAQLATWMQATNDPLAAWLIP